MASPKEQTFAVGPFRRVRTTPNPYDDAASDTVADAINCYMADPVSGGGIYQRPGTTTWGPVAAANEGQCVYSHTALSGTNYNFFFINGRLYRQSTDLSTTPTDVTPVGVAISATPRVYVTSLADSIIVNDGVNRPWIGTNLGGSPITGTYIDYDGAGGAWVAFGQPVIYTGAVFFILASVGGVAARTTIAWSEPNQPGVGYQQTDYDNAWTLTQTGSSPLYALAATNEALYYSRDLSWGAITGAPGVNFQNTATHDLVSANVGCTTPATVKRFLNYVYFADANGRPWRFAVGGIPEPIWLQAQTRFDGAGFSPSRVTGNWCAVIEPNLNVYVLGYAGSVSSGHQFSDVIVFDAVTGIYFGRWSFLIAAISAVGIMRNSDGLPQLVYIEAPIAGNVRFFKLALVTDGIWTDGGVSMGPSVQTGKMGYSASTAWTFPRSRIIVGYRSGSPAEISIGFATTQQTVTAGAATFIASPPETGLYRMTRDPAQLRGRDVAMTVNAPGLVVTAQFRLYRAEIDAIPSTANVDEW